MVRSIPYEYKYMVDGYAAMLKPGRDYLKWYDVNTKKALCENFQTLRDEAVLAADIEASVLMRRAECHI
jgi:hypothetical protein